METCEFLQYIISNGIVHTYCSYIAAHAFFATPPYTGSGGPHTEGEEETGTQQEQVPRAAGQQPQGAHGRESTQPKDGQN